MDISYAKLRKVLAVFLRNEHLRKGLEDLLAGGEQEITEVGFLDLLEESNADISVLHILTGTRTACSCTRALVRLPAGATRLTTSEVAELAPVLVDFADANASTGMSVASAFDLMGRVLNGHTEMLGRYGLELYKTKIEQARTACLRTRTPKPRLRALPARRHADCADNTASAGSQGAIRVVQSAYPDREGFRHRARYCHSRDWHGDSLDYHPHHRHHRA
ncbi:MAG: hypothetical protein K8R90_10020 [Candidatus Cloacimonetes bacterium]|nr:hypothetical protein [Candidatus Cloacimonadota bacterium]